MNNKEFTKKYYIDRSKSNSIKWQRGRKLGCLPMWVADMDFKCDEKIIKKLEEFISFGDYGYTNLPEDYYKVFCNWHKERNNVSYKQEWIRFTKGAVDAMYQIIYAFTEKDDCIMINTPLYPPFKASIKETGRKVDAKHAEQVARELGDSVPESIRVLQKGIENNRAQKGGGYKVDVLKEAENIASYTAAKYGMETLAKKGDISQKRKNDLFTNQINQSTKKDSLSLLDADTSKAFYAGTSDLWKEAKNSSQYNEKIMESFGVSDLETVYKLLTDKELDYKEFGFSNKEDFEDWLEEIDSRVHLFSRRQIIQTEHKRKSLDDTEDEDFNNDSETEYQTSPEEINRITTRIAEMLNEYE